MRTGPPARRCRSSPPLRLVAWHAPREVSRAGVAPRDAAAQTRRPDPCSPRELADGGQDLPSIRITVVPHTGHVPLAAFRPFFIVTSWPSNSRFLPALHAVA